MDPWLCIFFALLRCSQHRVRYSSTQFRFGQIVFPNKDLLASWHTSRARLAHATVLRLLDYTHQQHTYPADEYFPLPHIPTLLSFCCALGNTTHTATLINATTHHLCNGALDNLMWLIAQRSTTDILCSNFTCINAGQIGKAHWSRDSVRDA
jgi:hypothetical protein